jgi:hypothetical protein
MDIMDDAQNLEEVERRIKEISHSPKGSNRVNGKVLPLFNRYLQLSIERDARKLMDHAEEQPIPKVSEGEIEMALSAIKEAGTRMTREAKGSRYLTMNQMKEYAQLLQHYVALQAARSARAQLQRGDEER